jgi:hypothetical protein
MSDLPFDPNLNLVAVFESNDPVAIAMAKGALEDAGIPYVALNQIATLVQDIDPLLKKFIRIEVGADREQEARDLLALLETPASVPEDGDAE